MGKSTEPLRRLRLNPILCCPIPRNSPHYFCGPTAIPDNRCLTECDFIRKTPPSHGQIVDFEQLIRKTPPVYGQTEHLESTFFSNKDHSGEQESLTPQKTKHPCRLTEVSEAEQPYCPSRIASLPRIIRITQSSSTSHVSNGCTQMSLIAATRLPP